MTIRIVSLVSVLLFMMCGLCACATSDPQKQPNGDMTTTTAMTTVMTTTTADNTTAMTDSTTTTAMFADTPAAAITAEQAQAIALEDAGLTSEDVTRLRAELEYDNGRQYYDVQFFQGTVEYDYEIDAATGAIIEKDRDIDM